MKYSGLKVLNATIDSDQSIVNNLAAKLSEKNQTEQIEEILCDEVTTNQTEEKKDNQKSSYVDTSEFTNLYSIDQDETPRYVVRKRTEQTETEIQDFEAKQAQDVPQRQKKVKDQAKQHSLSKQDDTVQHTEKPSLFNGFWSVIKHAAVLAVIIGGLILLKMIDNSFANDIFSSVKNIVGYSYTAENYSGTEFVSRLQHFLAQVFNTVK